MWSIAQGVGPDPAPPVDQSGAVSDRGHEEDVAAFGALSGRPSCHGGRRAAKPGIGVGHVRGSASLYTCSLLTAGLSIRTLLGHTWSVGRGSGQPQTLAPEREALSCC